MYLKFSLIFTLLFIATLPFEQPLLPDFPALIAPFFELVSKWVATNLLGWSPLLNYRLESDSAGLYLHSGILLFISSSLAFAWHLLEKNDNRKVIYNKVLIEISSFYLSMHLFSYGFSKLFKAQFFFPEPNTLFTPLAYLDRDILFWSAMGTSHTYSVFSGIIELVPALLLIFPRTRTLGALIAFGVMVNVFMLNMGFDISVKLFSAFLIFLCLNVLSAEFRNLYLFFLSDLPIKRNLIGISRKNIIYRSIIGLFLIINGMFPFLLAGNFNDDLAPRPDLNGAYEINQFVLNGDSLAPMINDKFRWKRIFVHRRGYFIIQNMQDKMTDYKLKIDETNNILEITDYRNFDLKYSFNIIRNGDSMSLKGNFIGKDIYLKAVRIDLKKLPISNNNFHWMLN